MISQPFAVGTENAIPLPTTSQNAEEPVERLTTIKQLLHAIDPMKKAPMLWTTAVHLSSFASVPFDQLPIDILIDVVPAFRLFLKERHYATSTVSNYCHYAGNLLKRAEELGWVSGNHAVALAWAPIIDAVKNAKNCPKAVARYAIGKGIMPSNFGDPDLDTWGEWMKRCGRKYRTVRLLKWRFRSALVQQGMAHLLPHLRCRAEKPYRTRTADIPEPLRTQIRELLKWKQATFAKDRPTWTRHRPVSAKLLEAIFNRLYGFATNIAQYTNICSMWDLVNEEIVTAFIEWCINERGLSRWSLLRLSMIYGALRHHREYRDHDLSWMANLFSQLPDDDPSKLAERKAKKYLPYPELRRVPERIREIRSKKGCDPQHASWLMHDELLMRFLITLVWRQRNLRECRLGEPATANLFCAELPRLIHLAKPKWVEEALKQDPQRQFWQFHFRAHETKTGHDVRGILPLCLVRPLEGYLLHHRPKLVGPVALSTLFLNRNGGALDQQTTTDLVGQLTLEHAGRRVTPHLCRDILAYHWLDLFPEDYLTLSKILWHRSLKYTLGVYGRQFDESNGVRRVDEWLGAA